MDWKVVHEEGNWLIVVVSPQRLEEVNEVLPVNGSVVDNGQAHTILRRHRSYHCPVPLVNIRLVDTEVSIPLAPLLLLQ